MKKINLVLATVLASVVGFGSSAAMAESHSSGERSWKHSSGEHKGGKHHGKRGGKHGKRGGRHGGGKHMMKRMAEKLGLTDDQITQMQATREAQKVDGLALREEMKQLRQDMQSLDASDAAAVQALAAKKGQLTEKMFIARNAAKLAFEAILTDEQKAKMDEMKAERKAKREARKQKRMERKAAKEANAS